jgi:hypothetical protein
MQPINHLRKRSNIFIVLLSALIVMSVIFIAGFKLYGFIELITFKKIAGLPARMTLFNSQIGQFSILYPMTWTARDTPNGTRGDRGDNVIAVITNAFASPIIEISHPMSAIYELDEVVQWGQSRVEQKMGYKMVSIQPFAIQNYSGFMLEYLRDGLSWGGNIKIHCIDWFILNNNLGYDFSFCINQKNWEEGKPIFYQMIDSIQFTNGQ